jgi:hypothetical protein
MNPTNQTIPGYATIGFENAASKISSKVSILITFKFTEVLQPPTGLLLGIESNLERSEFQE